MVTLPDDQVKHLEFLQVTIARQASHSFAVKGWTLTVSTAVYAYTAAHLHWWLAVVALLPSVAFGWLDAFHLRQERLFRELYNACIAPNHSISVFSMDTTAYCNVAIYPRCGWKSVLQSKTWLVFHGLIVFVGAFLIGVAIFQML
jgi:hypothetical protein